jgi:UDPglucose 6-dehydrogenase
MNLSVIGLGKLGSPMAACFAAKGHRVVGVDLNEGFVQAINDGRAPVFEPNLQEMIDKGRANLTATTSVRDAVLASEITFVIVPTPSEPTGEFSMRYALSAAESIGQALKEKDTFHIVVMTSTVMPGDTEGKFVPALEMHSGKKVGKHFGVCYSPEFISLGSVVRDFLNPDFVLIGESDPATGEKLADLYQKAVDNTPRVARMHYVNAELTKLALNTFVTTKISYANMLAELCERLPGGNVDAVTSALGLDTRIGPKYLKGAVGYGGPCFPRDNVALTTLARSLGVIADLPTATDKTNLSQVPRLLKLIRDHLPAGGAVGILGLAYKPDTNVIEKSQAVEVAQDLLAAGTRVVCYDPCANDSARLALRGPVEFAESARDCTKKADVVLVMTPYREFKDVGPADLARGGRGVTVIDCWRMLPAKELRAVCHYVGLGTDDVLKSAGQPAAGLRKAS